MVKRSFWLNRLEKAWERRSLVWLTGVRRAGKTFLCQSLDKVEYFDCELPSVRRQLEDPEEFWKQHDGKRIILDEVQRLQNPSELLKIATDHFPRTKVIATGSSTLQASKKFRDTLTGRKEEVWLTPMIGKDLDDFHNQDLDHRMRQGGLPPFFLEKNATEAAYQEWLDSYWAKDIQELFHLERRGSFQRLLELLFANSGCLFEATKYATPCELSRSAVANYLQVMEATKTVHILKPFSSRQATEIVSAPKVYTFDTGFVLHFRGWRELRPEDKGILWEHLVLNELQARCDSRFIHYWRDKQDHEIDFVLARRGQPPVTIECKWSINSFDPANLRIFRKRYPSGENWVVASNVSQPYFRSDHEVRYECLGLEEMAQRLDKMTQTCSPSDQRWP